LFLIGEGIADAEGARSPELAWRGSSSDSRLVVPLEDDLKVNHLAAYLRRIIVATEKGIIPPDPSLSRREHLLFGIRLAKHLLDLGRGSSLYHCLNPVEIFSRLGTLGTAGIKENQKKVKITLYRLSHARFLASRERDRCGPPSTGPSWTSVAP
jgi:hypothetical protein